jgi:putative hemolysin
LDSSGYCLLFNTFTISAGIINPDFTVSVPFITGCIVLGFLLFTSGFMSGAETAFFAITPSQLMVFRRSKNVAAKLIDKLLSTPKRLLATLLITVNFVNIAIIVLSAMLISEVFNFKHHETVGFIIQAVIVAFVIVLFCEVMPKVYAQQNAFRTATISALPVYVLDKILRPLSYVLVAATSVVDKRIQQKGFEVSADQLSHAIDITSTKDTPEEEKNILKGIARFGNIDVKQIMKPRLDVIGVEYETQLKDLVSFIEKHRYSRLPVYKERFDHVEGVLYIKDILPHLDSADSFQWQTLVRPAYFVPESKKINDLLREFQEKKKHLAIVVDEYGGNSGIVTLEDILEEIVGEISDEFDEVELAYSKLDDTNYVFEGKALLNDVCRVIEVSREKMEVTNEDIDTLAGLILEIKGSIPMKGEVIEQAGFKFTVEAADRRRIKRVKISLPEKKEMVMNNE